MLAISAMRDGSRSLGFTRQPASQNQQVSDPNKRSYIKKQGGAGDLMLK